MITSYLSETLWEVTAARYRSGRAHQRRSADVPDQEALATC
jgi:hypothetical protein